MKTNGVGKIKMQNANSVDRNRFPFSHDVNTTFEFGSVQPLGFEFMKAGSKFKTNPISLIRLAPMNAPTFGRIRHKMAQYFVPMRSVFRNWQNFCSATPTAKPDGTQFVPMTLPTIMQNQLAFACLVGADIEIFKGNKLATPTAKSSYWGRLKNTPAVLAAYNLDSALTNTTKDFSSLGFPGVTSSYGLRLKANNARDTYFQRAFGVDGDIYHAVNTADVSILPIASSYAESMFDRSENAGGLSEFSMESADLFGSWVGKSSPAVYKDYAWAIAARLSNWGKRLKTILTGLGYHVDLNDETEVSLVPLLAFYKAYYDLYGIQRYKNWEMTPAYKLIERISDFASPSFAPTATYSSTGANNPLIEMAYDTTSVFWDFIRDLGDCWYTEANDWVSVADNPNTLSINQGAYNQKLVSQPSPTGSALSSIVYPCGNVSVPYYSLASDSPSDGVTWVGSDITDTSPSALGEIKNPFGSLVGGSVYSPVQLKVLMRMYTWCNRSSVAGMKIAEILRNNGLGKFVDETPVYFVGALDKQIDIADVTSTADTESKFLGEYTGKGVGYDEGKGSYWFYETNEAGFLITVGCVVPEAGYVNGLRTHVMATKFGDFHDPMFDGLGKELLLKDSFLPANKNGFGAYKAQNHGCGLVPRHHCWKHGMNLRNGEFDLNSKRASYMPYTLDKDINLGSHSHTENSDPTSLDENFSKAWTNNAVVTFDSVPLAGHDSYRQPTKYKFVGHFDRIFRDEGVELDSEYMSDNASTYYYTNTSDDNILGQYIFNMEMYSPMRGLEEEWDTVDENEKPNGAVSKA